MTSRTAALALVCASLPSSGCTKEGTPRNSASEEAADPDERVAAKPTHQADAPKGTADAPPQGAPPPSPAGQSLGLVGITVRGTNSPNPLTVASGNGDGPGSTRRRIVSSDMNVSLRAEVMEPIPPGAQVRLKARCMHDGHIFIAGSEVAAHRSKPLDRFAVGETAALSGRLRYWGLSPSPCQLSFELRGPDGVGVNVGEGCWDGGATAALTACDPPLIAPAMEHTASGVDVLGIEFSPLEFGSGVHLMYSTRFRETPYPSTSIVLGVACSEGEQVQVDFVRAFIDPELEFERGETLRHWAHATWDDEYFLLERPDRCDLSVLRWTTAPEGAAAHEVEVLYRACLRGTEVEPERCDGRQPKDIEAVDMTAANTDVDTVDLGVVQLMRGSNADDVFSIAADITVTAALRLESDIGAKVVCKFGSEKRAENVTLGGFELDSLLPGQTARVRRFVFEDPPLAAPPQWCQVELEGRSSSTIGAPVVNLGRYCLRGEKVSAGRC